MSGTASCEQISSASTPPSSRKRTVRTKYLVPLMIGARDKLTGRIFSETLINPETYNGLVSMHGSTMIFLVTRSR